MTREAEYLLSYGASRELARFRAEETLRPFKRGDLVVARGHRGLELAEVLGPATSRHHELPLEQPGVILRQADSADLQRAEQGRQLADQVYQEASDLVRRLELAIEILDVEIPLELERAILHYVHWEDQDVRPLVSEVSRTFNLKVTLQDLTTPALPSGSCGSGCGDCGTSGGCGSGGCGSCGNDKEDLQPYFAELREKMLQGARSPLL